MVSFRFLLLIYFSPHLFIIWLIKYTWASLFPNHFHENVSFPSFNVKDLHTVDQGVITNMIPSLIKKFGSPDLDIPAQPDLTHNGEWDVLIGHMLGVDHVGHRHGPDHPAMREKLEEVDGIIRKIIKIMQNSKEANDTILFVMVSHLFYCINITKIIY